MRVGNAGGGCGSVAGRRGRVIVKATGDHLAAAGAVRRQVWGRKNRGLAGMSVGSRPNLSRNLRGCLVGLLAGLLRACNGNGAGQDGTQLVRWS